MSSLLPLCLLCLVAGALLGGCAETRPRQGGSRPPADFVEGKRLFAELRYADAARCFRRAHQLEPGDEEILRYLRRAQLLMAEDDREHWAKVRQRHVSLSGIRDYRQILKSRKVTLDFPDTPFTEVISFLEDITGLNITISPEVDQEGITVSLRLREIPLEDALKVLLEQTELVMTVTSETLVVSPPSGGYDLEIYDVQDLLSQVPDFPGIPIRVTTDTAGGGGAGSFSFDTEEESDCAVLDADQLELAITHSVGEDTWDDPASIEVHKGQLIVKQTRERHWKIRDVLHALRCR